MSRSLPQNWIDGTLHTLNVVRDLGWGGEIVHPSLAVFRQKPSAKSRKTKHLQWRFLPERADDPRPFAGSTNRGQGKRLSIEGTSVDDVRRQYKGLIRNLFMEARSDFPALTCPDFPAMKMK